MKKRYQITLRTCYGSLTIDEIEAKSEKEAIEKAEKMAADEIINFSKVDEVYCYE
jgi:hypothetical protein